MVELLKRFLVGCDNWYMYGGWHRACLVLAFGLLLYAAIITYALLEKRKND